jgi:hypothetical protein
VRDVWRYHAATSGSVARHASVQASAALGGGDAPRELARSAGSNISVLPAAIENVVVPVATTVVPVGIAGCAGIGGSDAPGGNDAALDGEALADVAGDGGIVGAAVVGAGVVGDGRGVVAVGAAVVGTAAVVGVTAGVEVATMRSVSEHAAVTHSSAMAARMRLRELTARTRPV